MPNQYIYTFKLHILKQTPLEPKIGEASVCEWSKMQFLYVTLRFQDNTARKYETAKLIEFC